MLYYCLSCRSSFDIEWYDSYNSKGQPFRVWDAQNDVSLVACPTCGETKISLSLSIKVRSKGRLVMEDQSKSWITTMAIPGIEQEIEDLSKDAKSVASKKIANLKRWNLFVPLNQLGFNGNGCLRQALQFSGKVFQRIKAMKGKVNSKSEIAQAWKDYFTAIAVKRVFYRWSKIDQKSILSSDPKDQIRNLTQNEDRLLGLFKTDKRESGAILSLTAKAKLIERPWVLPKEPKAPKATRRKETTPPCMEIYISEREYIPHGWGLVPVYEYKHRSVEWWKVEKEGDQGSYWAEIMPMKELIRITSNFGTRMSLRGKTRKEVFSILFPAKEEIEKCEYTDAIQATGSINNIPKGFQDRDPDEDPQESTEELSYDLFQERMEEFMDSQDGCPDYDDMDD